MSGRTITVLTILLFTFFAFGGYAWYMKMRRRFSRERYAFSALGATITLVGLTVASVGIAPPWTIIGKLLAHLLQNPQMELPEPNWAESCLVIGLAAFAIWQLNRNFVMWNGPVSLRQHRMSKRQDPSTLLREGTVEALRLLRRDAVPQMYDQPEPAPLQLHLEAPTANRAWRDDARELVELRWQQYVFDADDGWHDKQRCWIGTDVKTKSTVALMCCQNPPLESDLSQFISYSSSLRSSIETEFIVATRTGKQQSVQIGGVHVRVESEDSLLEDLVDFTDYVFDMRRRVERETLPDSEWTISDVYVQSRVVDPDGSQTHALEDYLIAWLNETGNRHLAVLGEYGQGKSTGTLMFAYRLLVAESSKGQPVPIYFELRGKSPSTLQPVELLGAWASAYRIDPRALMKLLIKGRIFMIFEGFDEMSGVADNEARLNHFRSLWRFAYPNAKLLFTGRPNFFLDDTELKAALGMSSGTASGPYCQHISLKPFGFDQIRQSLRWADTSVRDDILDFAKNDEKFCDIVSRPSLLYIVGRLWGESDFIESSETVDAAHVMGAFIQHCYRRQTEKHRGYAQFMDLREEERAYFMDGVAAFMAAGRLPNQITRLSLDKAVAELYELIPSNIVQDASHPEPVGGALRARMAERDDALDAVQTNVRTYGLLVRDYSRPNTLKFPHKSFFEYLLASLISDSLLRKRPDHCAAIRSATTLDPIHALNVPESLVFLGEIISRGISSREDPGTIADTLLNAIVMPRTFSIPRFFQRIYLRFLVFPMVPGWKGALARLFLVSFAMIPIFLGIREVVFGESYVEPIHMLAIAVLTQGILWVLLQVASRRRKNVAMWYTVTRSLGVSDEALSREFGRHLASGIAEVERAFMSQLGIAPRSSAKTDLEMV